MMQIEFRYSGGSKRTSLTKDCSMDDILSAFSTLYEIENVEEQRQSFDVNLFNDNNGDGEIICLEDPSNQLFEGAIIDIKQKEMEKAENNIVEQQNEENKQDENENESENHNDDEQQQLLQQTEQEKAEETVSPSPNSIAKRRKAPRYVARLRGLPWSARESDISEFFTEEKVVEVQIVFLTDGRASGEALVEFGDRKSFQSSFLRNRQHIGHRYIEIFKSTAVEIDTAAGRMEKPAMRTPKSQFVIRMRGLPYSASEEDVFEFFKIPKPSAVHLIKDDLGRPSGEGFSEFMTEVDAIAAMAKHRHHMAHRYIELFRSSSDELLRALGLTGNVQSNVLTPQAMVSSNNSISGGNKQPHRNNDYLPANPHPQYSQQPIKSTCLLMRGLPYSCTESDITKFFQEIDVTPIRIHRKADGAEAYVEFYNNSDTDTAMSRHRSYIGRRYIELFRVTYEDMARTVGLPISSTNIPASALSLSNSLIGFNPLYALQSRPSHSSAHHGRPSPLESYHAPQHNPYIPNSHYQPPPHVGTVSGAASDSSKHSYVHAPSQPLLFSAANINMNAALMSQSNMNPSVQQRVQQQQQYHYQQQQQAQQQAPYYQ